MSYLIVLFLKEKLLLFFFYVFLYIISIHSLSPKGHKQARKVAI